MIILDSETDPPVSKIATATLTLSATFFLIKKNTFILFVWGTCVWRSEDNLWAGSHLPCGFQGSDLGLRFSSKCPIAEPSHKPSNFQSIFYTPCLCMCTYVKVRRQLGFCLFLFLRQGLLYIVLAVLTLAMWTRQASLELTEILLPLSPECWN